MQCVTEQFLLPYLRTMIQLWEVRRTCNIQELYSFPLDKYGISYVLIGVWVRWIGGENT